MAAMHAAAATPTSTCVAVPPTESDAAEVGKRTCQGKGKGQGNGKGNGQEWKGSSMPGVWRREACRAFFAQPASDGRSAPSADARAQAASDGRAEPSADMQGRERVERVWCTDEELDLFDCS